MSTADDLVALTGSSICKEGGRGVFKNELFKFWVLKAGTSSRRMDTQSKRSGKALSSKRSDDEMTRGRFFLRLPTGQGSRESTERKRKQLLSFHGNRLCKEVHMYMTIVQDT
eukprot:TRINITY_DN8546_c0_g1_i1.p1 TRINITY_DN8546_c0_g1~~TRINITY_DN8546_c0_g1_i1.p1  ORF type:complete len:112 (-),score=3.18 TRINITY_DN8546_c0_g1_i1:68-403(-)